MKTDYLLQTALFAYSLALGALLGALYGVLWLLRFAGLRGRVSVFLQDVVFCLASALAYMLLLYNYSFGAPRFYSFCGVLFGYFAWHFTFGLLLRKAFAALRSALAPVFASISGKLASTAYERRFMRRLSGRKKV